MKKGDRVMGRSESPRRGSVKTNALKEAQEGGTTKRSKDLYNMDSL